APTYRRDAGRVSMGDLLRRHCRRAALRPYQQPTVYILPILTQNANVSPKSVHSAVVLLSPSRIVIAASKLVLRQTVGGTPGFDRLAGDDGQTAGGRDRLVRSEFPSAQTRVDPAVAAKGHPGVGQQPRYGNRGAMVPPGQSLQQRRA